jgi:hexosaminidase
VKTIRAGETVTFTVPANDVMAGAPSLDLTTNERLLLVKPPRVSTGKNVFQREVYFKDKTTVSIEGQTPGAVIHYTLNGSEPTSKSPVYEEPIPIARSATVRTLAIKNGRQSVVSQPVRFERLSAIRDVTISPDPAPEYAGHGPLTLVDGKRGAPNAPGNDWLGFEEKDVEVLVDLGEARTINLITAGFLSDQRRWIFHPTAVEYAAGTARDNMRTIYAKNFTTEKLELAAVKDITAKVKPIRARYVRVRAKNVGVCPPWHPGAGGKAWLFMDEIAVK